MSGVYAAVFLVGCAANLLDCAQIQVQNAVLTDMEACNARLQSAKTTAVEQKRYPVIYGKCHYILVEDAASQGVPVS